MSHWPCWNPTPAVGVTAALSQELRWARQSPSCTPNGWRGPWQRRRGSASLPTWPTHRVPPCADEDDGEEPPAGKAAVKRRKGKKAAGSESALPLPGLPFQVNQHLQGASALFGGPVWEVVLLRSAHDVKTDAGARGTVCRPNLWAGRKSLRSKESGPLTPCSAGAGRGGVAAPSLPQREVHLPGGIPGAPHRK